METRRLRVGKVKMLSAGVATLAAVAFSAVGSLQAAATSGADNWSMFHADALHSGVSPDTSPGAASASGLALKWKTFVGGGKNGIVSSPAVVYNPTLSEYLVYAATQGSGTVMAINATTGATVWSYNDRHSIKDSPAVSGNTLYFGDQAHVLHALNATTGVPICTYTTTGELEASPVVGNVDGTGDVVFIGDRGFAEKRNAGHEWAINGVGNTNGQCTLKWSFNNFGITDGGTRTGTWSSPALGQDKNGRWLVVFGTTNPDDSVYALDAAAGTEVWDFVTATGGDADVGAGATISPPGVNGFADGEVYIDGKDQVMYSIDLTTGVGGWTFNLKANAGSGAKAICTPTLTGTDLLCPYNQYVYDLDAVTGALSWRSSATGTASFVASAAVSGAAGDQVVFAGDEAGMEHGYSLATGASVFSYQAGGTIISSTAVSSNMIFFGAVDGDEYGLG